MSFGTVAMSYMSVMAPPTTWHRLKTVLTTSVTSVTVTFDEPAALGNTHTLFAVVMFDDPVTSISSTNWGTTMLDGSGNNGAAL